MEILREGDVVDWRERDYYLVNLNESSSWWEKGHDDYGSRFSTYLKMIKNEADSIKISPPYNHFKNNDRDYDGNIKEIGYIQQMFSCNKSEAKAFEDVMNSICEHDRYAKIIKLNKEMCEQ